MIVNITRLNQQAALQQIGFVNFRRKLASTCFPLATTRPKHTSDTLSFSGEYVPMLAHSQSQGNTKPTGQSAIEQHLTIDPAVLTCPPPNTSPECVVLIACGSFNPPTIMHMRIMELAKQHLQQHENMHVLCGVFSPVSDAYQKPALLPAHHRANMLAAAVQASPWLCVHTLEASKSSYTRTLHVVQQIIAQIDAIMTNDSTKEKVKVHPVLVCGEDLVESMTDPQIWPTATLTPLLSTTYIACISRAGGRVADMLADPGCRLRGMGGRIYVINEPVKNEVSSSLVRAELSQQRVVKWLVPDGVLDYIQQHKLYQGQ